ncbi:hypothetical protein K402DRAFT_401163 [Aulographum hederae CBS 113979]|uniref:C2H2-type domain-containing protein n=1 Tax=Aulographum hederae CBS 113979 TaxID=1176131 RepID=A0A6G1HBB7_9PEZI|nr:hypothetical protein K402DRAFT_401163 [Aulographum hederae CBS 113979]
MTKRKKFPTLQETLERTPCYYCDRDFEDGKVLMEHQRTKHFKCSRCPRKLNTAGGLAVHMQQVHKEDLRSIENAIPSRSGIDLEVYGILGYPDDLYAQWKQRKTEEYWREAEERGIKTGNLGQQHNPHQPSKRPKLDSKESIKANKELWKKQKEEAKKKAEEAAASASGSPATPFEGGVSFALPYCLRSNANLSQQTAQPSATNAQAPYSPTVYSPPIAYTGVTYGAPVSYAQPTTTYNGVTYSAPMSYSHAPAPAMHGAYHSHPVPGPQYQSNAYGQQQYGGHYGLNRAGTTSASPPVGGGYPAPMYHFGNGMNTPIVPRRGSLPDAPPSLPRRPDYPANLSPAPFSSAATPTVNATPVTVPATSTTAADLPAAPASIDSPAVVDSPATNEVPAHGVKKAKKSKKAKEKSKVKLPIKLTYSENDVSIEEKRAMLTKYRWMPDNDNDVVMGDVGPAVTGSVDPAAGDLGNNAENAPTVTDVTELAAESANKGEGAPPSPYDTTMT